MIPTMDVQIECPWCGEAVLMTDAASAVTARCSACAIAVDLADPAPNQGLAGFQPGTAAAA